MGDRRACKDAPVLGGIHLRENYSYSETSPLHRPAGSITNFRLAVTVKVALKIVLGLAAVTAAL